jgi:hypothetical protein
MTFDRPNYDDDIEISADVIAVNRFYMVVRNRATQAEHVLSYDNIEIGSSATGDCYTVKMPAWLARMEGIDAR